MKKRLFLFLLVLIFGGCAEFTSPLVKVSRLYLGTTVEITVTDRDKPRHLVKQAIDKAFAEIERVEDLFSRFKAQSEISRINTEAYLKPTKASLETISLIEKSIVFSQLSDGAFDITVLPLMEVWGFGDKKRQGLPQAEELTEALGKVGYEYIDVLKSEQAIFLGKPAMGLDLGGIATGYAVDRAIAILRQEGIKNALVNAGGDIYALGCRARRNKAVEKWRIGVQHPQKKNAILSVLELEDEAVATSGDYAKYINLEGRRYSHIMNPKTGYPCEYVPMSVTVLAKDCLTADALSTSVFVLGPQKGIDLVDQIEGAEAIVAYLQGPRQDKLDIWLSLGLKGKLEFKSSTSLTIKPERSEMLINE